MVEALPIWTYERRIEALRETKLRQTKEKQALGPMDLDDKGSVPLEGFTFAPDDDYFGPRGLGRNLRRYLEEHPVYVDPVSSLAGGWRAWMMSYLPRMWPEGGRFDYSHLHEEQRRYQLVTGIGGVQHFCPDVTIGLELGWGGLLAKVRHWRDVNAEKGLSRYQEDFYDGLEDVLLGLQNWICRTAEEAARLAETEAHEELRRNLQEMAEINRRLVNDPPRTFRDACQWIAWMEMFLCMFNGSGALGQVDELLRPYYEHDATAGVLDDEEAVFHLACMLLKETHYMQVGGPDPAGRDMTSRVSFLVLEAAHRLKVPCNIAIRVHDGLDPDLFELGVRHLFEDRTGNPNWMGARGLDEGFVRNGYPLELARTRVKSGCHWCAIPGREYTLNDIVKINFPRVFEVAMQEMAADPAMAPSTALLWERFEAHLRRAVNTIALGLDFHLEHFRDVLPELPLDLFCHGTVEQGKDASGGGVEFYNMCVDGSGLATVADSFAALEQRVEREGRLTWPDIMRLLEIDFEGAEGERLVLGNSERFGQGGSLGDDWAQRISRLFVSLVKEKPTPEGRIMIPGLFTWAASIAMGRGVGATPNGRHKGAPIAHGPNPDPAPGNTPTSMSRAVASVECGYGNTSPLQLDMDPGTGATEAGRAKVGALIRTHCDMGGTLINLNIVNREQILEAHRDPSKYPDLIVRVTGFSAYFASLSDGFRQLVVDRIVAEG